MKRCVDTVVRAHVRTRLHVPHPYCSEDTSLFAGVFRYSHNIPTFVRASIHVDESQLFHRLSKSGQNSGNRLMHSILWR